MSFHSLLPVRSLAVFLEIRGPVQSEYPCGPPHEKLNPEFRLTLRLNVLGTTPSAANWTSRDGSGEKPGYILHESLNRSMHFALKGEGALDGARELLGFYGNQARVEGDKPAKSGAHLQRESGRHN